MGRVTRRVWALPRVPFSPHIFAGQLLCAPSHVPIWCFGSVQFRRSVVSDSLWSHEPQHARPPCPSPTPGVYPNPCPSSRWCHPTILSSVTPFSSCPQSFPASGSFQMSQLFASGGQSIGVSALTSVVFHSKNTGSHQIWVSMPTIFVKKYWALLFFPFAVVLILR